MAKFTFSFADDKVVILDGQNKAEPLDLLDILDPQSAIAAIGKEQAASVNASRGALSLLATMLDNPRFDAYKGQTPHNEKVSAEFRGALRDVETEFMKPVFVQRLLDRGNTPAYAEKAWQEYVAGLRTGSYANAKTYVSKLFAHCGQLPVAPNGKLLPLRAIMRILENSKGESDKPENEGITGKLLTLSEKIKTHNGDNWDILGNIPSGIAALKSMLAVYEAVQRETSEAVTAAHMGLNAVANAVISNAQTVADTEDSLTALWNNGQLSDDEFKARMSAIGIDVELQEPAPF